MTGEPAPVIGLDTFNPAGKCHDEMLRKHGGGIRAVFLKGFHIPPSGILVNGCVLEKFFTGDTGIP